MTDARGLLEAYLRQRLAAGESHVIFPDQLTLTPGPSGPQAASDEAPAADRPRSGPRERSAEREPAPESVTKGKRKSNKPKWQQDVPDIPEQGIVIPTPSSDLFSSDPLANLTLEALNERVRGCQECALCEHRTNAVPGEGPVDARLVVVGEGPGAREDELGRPFVGRAGELLTDILKAIDLPREQVFICNVVKCRPPSNRTPAQNEIEACVPYLHRQLAIVAPAVILAMGTTAAQTLLQTRQSLGAMRGKVHEYRGIPLIVTYHPAALLRNPNWKKPTWDDVRIARQLVDRG